MADHNPDAQAIIEAVERLSEPQYKLISRGTADNAALFVVPKGKEVVSVKKYLDEYLDRPLRKEGTATLTTLEAFNVYVQRHMTHESAVFCDDTQKQSPRIVAIFDAHASHASGAGANWQKHRAQYAFPLSEEWIKWSALQGDHWLGQADFAAFIEDRICDVIDPGSAGQGAKQFAESVGAQLATPVKLLELSRGLAINVDAQVATKVNLSSGEGHLVFKESHKDENGAPVKVPGAFVIAIPVFRLGPAYSVPVRLRYRVSGGKVHWQLALQRVDHVFESAIAEASASVAEVTGLPVFRGKPD